jgi:Protein of unknown function (DUF2934)
VNGKTRQRAFEIWERQGKSGDPVAHWIQAERELAREATGAADQLAADGKRYGIAVTDYLLDTIKYRKLTLAAAVDLAAANIERQTNEMLDGGRSREDVLAWVRAIRQALEQRLSAILAH